MKQPDAFERRQIHTNVVFFQYLAELTAQRPNWRSISLAPKPSTTCYASPAASDKCGKMTLITAGFHRVPVVARTSHVRDIANVARAAGAVARSPIHVCLPTEATVETFPTATAYQRFSQFVRALALGWQKWLALNAGYVDEISLRHRSPQSLTRAVCYGASPPL